MAGILTTPGDRTQQAAVELPSMPRRGRRGIAGVLDRNRRLLPGLVLCAIIALSAVAAPLLSPYDPTLQILADRLRPPSMAHPLGTDAFGRDVLSRVLYAGRVSLLVGLAAVALATLIGACVGLVAGHVGGKIDLLLMRLTDVFMAFPTLLLALALLAIFGGGLISVILAIGISSAPMFVRMVRGTMLSVRERDYVLASRTIGASGPRIVLRHVLPNIVSPIIVLASLRLGAAILTEANLSFLGLGIGPPTPTWGNMVADGQTFLTRAPWTSVVPGVAIMLSVLGFSVLGDALRDLYDPRIRQG
jgi:peptide/nickel transport system permease protein